MVAKAKLGNAKGRVVTVRTLPGGKYEMTFRGQGVFVNVPIQDCGTITLERTPAGGIRIEGWVNLDGPDASLTWKGAGLAKDGSKYPMGSFAVFGEFTRVSGKFSHLADTVCLPIFQAADDETYFWECTEWTFS